MSCIFRALNKLPSVVLGFALAGLPLASYATQDQSGNQKLSAEYIQKFQNVGEELNLLSKAGAQSALQELTQTDLLEPFAIVLNQDGTLGKIQPQMKFIKDAPFAEKISFLRGQIKDLAEKGLIKAGALFSRGFGRTKDKQHELPGLLVEQEHKQGPSTIQFVPYEKNSEGVYVALNATSNPKPRLFFNEKISSQETYNQIKELTEQTQNN